MMYLGENPIGLNTIHCRMASGEFTQVSGVAYLNHNLGTKKIFVIMQRINSDHSNIDGTAQFRSILMIGATKEALQLDTDQSYSFNSGTQAKWDATNTTSPKAYPNGLVGFFPGTTDTFPPTVISAYAVRGITAEDANGESVNTVRVYPPYALEAGRWIWRVYALD